MPNQYPYHIAIILDGNRRYAKQKNLQSWQGHEFGAKKVQELIKWSLELGIKQLTLYTFSIENFTRTKKEVGHIMSLFRKYFSQMKKQKKKDMQEVKINFIGRLSLFPNDIQKMMQEIMKKTENNQKLILNFAIGYGGRTEIIDGIKKILQEKESGKSERFKDEITEQKFMNYLYLNSEPNIIIRPGGEKRVSNFLIYQGAYSEWFFLDKLWPEITKQDFINVLEEFKSRERRFGK